MLERNQKPLQLENPQSLGVRSSSGFGVLGLGFGFWGLRVQG